MDLRDLETWELNILWVCEDGIIFLYTNFYFTLKFKVLEDANVEPVKFLLRYCYPTLLLLYAIITLLSSFATSWYAVMLFAAAQGDFKG